MKMQIELINGFGFAVSWHKCLEHDFAIIILCFAVKFKQITKI